MGGQTRTPEATTGLKVVSEVTEKAGLKPAFSFSRARSPRVIRATR